MDLKKAIENRKRFLAPYREKFKAEKEVKKLKAEKAAIELNKLKIGRVETENQRPEIDKKQAAIRRKEKAIKKKKAGIISDLVALESSHLSEPWIMKEVIAWLRDRECLDFLEEVFIKAPKRAARTEDQRRNAVRDFYVVNDIDKIITGKNISVRKACEILARKEYEKEGRYYLLWDTTDLNLDLEKAIRQVYNNAKEKSANLLKNFMPPWPYYGRDVEVDENGEITIFGGR